ncbi:4-hydroxy-tetrahydrodipicolinate synthase [Bartonella sp. HY761]|uniref:4-hydroxy-tetrahydrodipicolinate synthase n=1 Tax=Bartonella sp. HY761 TaxID=2979330 RepID=UPI0021FA9B3E|nr:4-hydroxy-tetrahydrodipicolinate synthase [Bartonella sp. HY761]UXN06560.1 4-hydroxy-tetrahydrodipicolinate synthase [Bartonella sp. HY761]
MLTSHDLKGIIPAIPTPLNNDDTINIDASKALFSWLLQQGIDGVLPIGGTGEYGSLARAERLKFVELSKNAVEGKKPVIAGVLDAGYYDAIAAGKDLASAGADALLVVTPYYTNPTQTGLYDYYSRYADASPIPVLIYEIPYRTRIAINPEIIHKLSHHQNIIGMKACNTDMYHFLQVVAGVSDNFSVLSGEDSLFPLHMAAGAKGGIVVTATMLPKAWRLIFDLVNANRLQEALEIHRAIIPLLNLTFAETNPGPMKSVLDLVKVNAPHMLLPLEKPNLNLSNSLRETYAALIERFEK